MTQPHPHLAEALTHETTDKRIDILRRIGEAGSISEAARGAGVSYKAAWQALETLSNLAGTPLVEKAVGGSGGGGAALTPAGRRVLEAATMLTESRLQVLSLLEHGSFGVAGAPNLAAMALRTSMRNQFPCTVKSLVARDGLVRVELTMPNGGQLFSRITRESAQLLGLAKGISLLALFKATAVQVAQHIESARSRNILHGEVTRASRSAKGGEVVLQLDGGVNLVGFAKADHGLKVGHTATACIEESGVVLAMSG